jgi:anti-sigma regulatory factor (Ser/Thr protein kinase)
MPTATADRRDTFRVSKHKRSVPGVRTRIGKTLADWGISGTLADDVTLSVDELVSNAIRHCRVTFALIEITVSVEGGALLLEVSDPDRDKTPNSGPPTPTKRADAGCTSSHSWRKRGATGTRNTANASGHVS